MNKYKAISLKALGLLKYLENLEQQNILFFSLEDARDALQAGVEQLRNAFNELKAHNLIEVCTDKNLLGQWQAQKFKIIKDNGNHNNKDQPYTAGFFLSVRDKIIEDIKNKKYSNYTEYSLICLLRTSTLEKMNKKINRHEINFGTILHSMFQKSGIYFIPQYQVQGYNIDYYNEYYKLAIEYDEPHHQNQLNKDIQREIIINRILNCHFIRIKQGKEIDGISDIFSYLINFHKHK